MNRKLAGLDIALIIVSTAIFGLTAWLGSMWGWQWLMWLGIVFGVIQLMALVMPPLRNYMYIVPMTIAQKVSRYRRNKNVRQDPKGYIMWGAGFMAAAVGILIIVYSAKDSSDSELVSIVLSPLFAVMVSLAVNRIGVGVYKLAEDATKQCTELAYLCKMYDTNKYLHSIRFDGRSMPQVLKIDVYSSANRQGKGRENKSDDVYSILYDDLYCPLHEQCTIEVLDHPDKQFVLPEFAVGQYTELLAVHSASSLENSPTVRLDSLAIDDNNHIELHTSRSTYYNDLVTNRASDFRCANIVSLREVYEFGPHLVPLDRSVMSNHIGINMLIELNDGGMVFLLRGSRGTMSKNKITSSIAAKMTTIEDYIATTGEPTDTKLDGEYVQYKCAQLLARSKLGLRVSEMNIKLIGIGRNIYDCGKPQFYYHAKLEELDTEQFYAIYKKDILLKSAKDTIDVNVDVYVCRLENIKYSNGHLILDMGNGKKRKVRAEESCIINIYHYLQWCSRVLE